MISEESLTHTHTHTHTKDGTVALPSDIKKHQIIKKEKELDTKKERGSALSMHQWWVNKKGDYRIPQACQLQRTRGEKMREKEQKRRDINYI